MNTLEPSPKSYTRIRAGSWLIEARVQRYNYNIAGKQQYLEQFSQPKYYFSEALQHNAKAYSKQDKG